MTKATELRELATLTTVASGQIQFDSDLKIAGDLITTGNTINITADTLNISDPNITLASGAANSAIADGAGITIDGANATLTWDDANSRFEFNKKINAPDGTIIGQPGKESIFTYSNGNNSAIIYSASGNMELRGTSTDYYQLFLKSGGNVGIGTDNPGCALDVTRTTGWAEMHLDGASGGDLIFKDNGVSYGEVYAGNGHGLVVKSYASQDIYFLTNAEATPKMVIESGGNVGIGVDPAIHKLDVDGAIATRQVRHSIRPTLNLDFANSKELDPRITFYRDSIATYYDSKGVLRYANTNTPRFDHDPATGESKGLLIEEARTNGFAYTDQMSYGNYWSGYGLGTAVGISPVVIPNYGMSPDGKFNATRLKMTTNGGSGVADRMFWRKCDLSSVLPTDGTATMSCWIKTVDGSSQQISWHVNGGYSSAFSIDGEWTRYTYTNSMNMGACFGLEILGTNPDVDVLIWGMQMEYGDFPTSYVPSDTRFTSRSSVATYHDENGILRTAPANTPRYGYKYDGRKWVETRLILENASTNYMTRPMSAFAYNMAVAPTYDQLGPDGSNTAVDVEVSSSNWPTDYFYTSYTDHRASTVAGTYTFSFFVKPDTSGEWPFNIYFDNAHHRQSATVVAGIWQRVSYTFTTLASNLTFNIYTYDNRSAQGDISSGVVWGPQVEDGYVATSYIYTPNGTATRSADVASSVAYTREAEKVEMYDIQNDWYNDEHGTFYSDSSSSQANGRVIDVNYDGGPDQAGGDTTKGSIILIHNTNTPLVVWNGSNAVVVNGPNQISSGKMAFRYDTNNFAVTANGISPPETDASGNVPLATQLNIGGRGADTNTIICGHVKTIRYYDEPLTDAELVALTENN